ncbi:MAG: hypothetical protein IKR92_00165 [Alphaproteobacteria bacterium]|nr:hypothetical protein [Alphaproteobacteria bacterium]
MAQNPKIITMNRATEPPKKHPSLLVQERDDLLGKNHTRSVNGDAPEGPFHGEPPYRKRTEDLDDSL